MKEEMERLIDLQQIDSEIAGFDKAIAKCEDELAKREQSIEQKQEKLATLQAKIERLSEKQKENQEEHEQATARVKDRQNKMLLVQTSREHQALLKEIEENKKLAKDTEERALQFIEQLEQLEVEAKGLNNQCKGEQDLLKKEQQSSAKEIKRLATAKKSIEGERAAKVAAVQPNYIQRYTKLIDRRSGLAVVAVQDSICLGCHMTLPPQQVNEVMKGDKLNICPTCQRILYFKVEEDAQEESLVE